MGLTVCRLREYFTQMFFLRQWFLQFNKLNNVQGRKFGIKYSESRILFNISLFIYSNRSLFENKFVKN